MIKSFKHRGLKKLYEDGEARGIRPDLVERVAEILARLDEVLTAQAMDLPGYRPHPLKGSRNSFWCVTVRANWRIVFHFENGEAFDVELIDDH